MGDQCIGGNAQELRFIYTSDTLCSGNNTQSTFVCVDELATDEALPSSVYIKALHGDTTFYEGIVNEGNVFSIFVGGGSNSMDIEIMDLTDNFGAGELLQKMTLSVRCREEDSLTLLDTFGSLQLVGFRNEEEGLKSVYTDLTIQYVAKNVGIRSLILTSALRSTPMTGTQSLLSTTETVLSVSRDTKVFSELLTVNLAAIVGGLGLDFSLAVQGIDSVTGNECEDSDSYTLQIIEA